MAAKKMLLVATVLCIILIISGIFIIVNRALHSGTLNLLTGEEKQEILESKKPFVDNLFKGYAEYDYTVFSRDMNDNIKEIWDRAQFLKTHNDYGDFLTKDCSYAEKSVGSVAVLCEVEFEKKRARFTINFDLSNVIFGLNDRIIRPDVAVVVNSNKTAESLKVTFNDTRKTLVPPEEYIFLILDVMITNNENKPVNVHAYKFNAGNYVFGALEQEYMPDCSMIASGELKAHETRNGCLVFSVQKGYEQGLIAAE